MDSQNKSVPQGWLQDVITQPLNIHNEYNHEVTSACRKMIAIGLVPSFKLYQMAKDANARYNWLNSQPGRFIEGNWTDYPLKNLYLVKVEKGRRLVFPMTKFLNKFKLRGGEDGDVTPQTMTKDVLYNGLMSVNSCSVYRLLYKTNPPVMIGDDSDFPEDLFTLDEALKKTALFVHVNDQWDESLVVECLSLIPKWTIDRELFSGQFPIMVDEFMDTVSQEAKESWLSYCSDNLNDSFKENPLLVKLSTMGVFPIQLLTRNKEGKVSSYFQALLTKKASIKLTKAFPSGTTPFITHGVDYDRKYLDIIEIKTSLDLSGIPPHIDLAVIELFRECEQDALLEPLTIVM